MSATGQLFLDPGVTVHGAAWSRTECPSPVLRRWLDSWPGSCLRLVLLC